MLTTSGDYKYKIYLCNISSIVMQSMTEFGPVNFDYSIGYRHLPTLVSPAWPCFLLWFMVFCLSLDWLFNKILSSGSHRTNRTWSYEVSQPMTTTLGLIYCYMIYCYMHIIIPTIDAIWHNQIEWMLNSIEHVISKYFEDMFWRKKHRFWTFQRTNPVVLLHKQMMHLKTPTKAFYGGACLCGFR